MKRTRQRPPTRKEQEAFLESFLIHTTDTPDVFTKPVHPYLELPNGRWVATEGILWRIADEYAHIVIFDMEHFTLGQWSFPPEVIAWFTDQGVFKQDAFGRYLDEEAFKQLALTALPQMKDYTA